MKIEIEEYKGQTIFYEDDYDKFICDITIEDRFSSKKRQSLKDIRKEIDVFIKQNSEFKPFYFLEDTWGDINVKYVSGIRTDGKLIVSDGKDSKHQSHYDKRDFEKMMVFDSDIVAEMKEARRKFDEAGEIYEAKKKVLKTKLIKLDLSKYEHIINQK